MSGNIARDIRAHLTDARALCTALGLTLAPRASKRQALVCCPWHGEKTPSCSVRLAKDGTLAAKCHACGKSGDALTLISQVRGLDFRETLKEGAAIANAPSLADDIEDAATPEPEREGLADATYHAVWSFILDALSPMRTVSPDVWRYLEGRGIAADAEACGVRGLPNDRHRLARMLLRTFERRDLEGAGVLRTGLDALDWIGWPLCIPWRDRFGQIACVQRRAIDDRSPKYRAPRGRSPRAPFGGELLAAALAQRGADSEVVFVEGALDCLARRRIAHEEGERCAVVGVYSASTPCAGLPLDQVKGRRVVLALDADGPGERACALLADVLARVAGELVRERPAAPAKDWGEALLRGAS